MDGTVAMGVTTNSSISVRDSVFIGTNVVDVAIPLVIVKLPVKYKFHSIHKPPCVWCIYGSRSRQQHGLYPCAAPSFSVILCSCISSDTPPTMVFVDLGTIIELTLPIIMAVEVLPQCERNVRGSQKIQVTHVKVITLRISCIHHLFPHLLLQLLLGSGISCIMKYKQHKHIS